MREIFSVGEQCSDLVPAPFWMLLHELWELRVAHRRAIEMEISDADFSHAHCWRQHRLELAVTDEHWLLCKRLRRQQPAENCSRPASRACVHFTSAQCAAPSGRLVFARISATCFAVTCGPSLPQLLCT